jgi:translation elongation factor EF-G
LLAAAEMDDALAEQVLAEQEPDPDAVWAALRQATLAGKVCPCFAGSALRNRGVQPLLDGSSTCYRARPNGRPVWRTAWMVARNGWR